VRYKKGENLGKQFIVEKLLGSGGMGDVYLVTRKTPDKTIEFAAKMLSVKKKSDKYYRIFLKELQTWIDLPEHPYLTECYFYRTIDNRLVIFSEYVKGGNLKQWIRLGRIRSMEQLLTIAIKIATGLQTAHNFGVIHQDVKPANILMTENGNPKITDFGISGFKSMKQISQESSIETTALDKTVLVTSHGMTPAYGSPEQANNIPVGRKTDIWSLGIAIFEMLTRKVTWQFGLMVPGVLEQYFQSDKGGILPDCLYSVIAKCLAIEPENRWSSMSELAAELYRIYPEITGVEPDFSLPEDTKCPKSPEEITRQMRGFDMLNPEKWLIRAGEIDGDTPENIAPGNSMAYRSGYARTLVLMEQYHLAAEIFKWHLQQGKKQLRMEYAGLMFEKALTHRNSDDFEGALTCYQEVLENLHGLIQDSPDDMLTKNRLAVTLMEEATLLQFTDPARGRLKLEQTISIMLQIFIPENHQYCLENLCRAYHNYANACIRTNDLAAAQTAYNNAVDKSEEIIGITGNPNNHDLAAVLIERANLIRHEDPDAAEADYLRAIYIMESSKEGSKNHDISKNIINAYSQYGNHLNLLNRFDEAIAYLDTGTELVNRMIEIEGWQNMLQYKGNLMYYRACCLYGLNRLDDARQANDEGILLLQKAVYRYFRQDCDEILKLSLALKEKIVPAT